MNRRDIFKGGAGAMAAVALSGKGPGGQHPGYPPPSIDSNFTRTAVDRTAKQALDLIPDPLAALRASHQQKIRGEFDRLDRMMDLKWQSLSRLKSVSEAWRMHQMEKIRDERDALRRRRNQLEEAVWAMVS